MINRQNLSISNDKFGQSVHFKAAKENKWSGSSVKNSKTTHHNSLPKMVKIQIDLIPLNLFILFILDTVNETLVMLENVFNDLYRNFTANITYICVNNAS